MQHAVGMQTVIRSTKPNCFQTTLVMALAVVITLELQSHRMS